MKSAIDLRNPVGTPFTNPNATTNLTTSYVQMIASTTVPCSAVEVTNTSAVPVVIGIGAPGSEVDKVVAPPGSSPNVIPWEIPKGSRLAAKGVGASATTGFLTFTFYS